MASYNVLETTVGVLAYAAVGALSAFAVDLVLPDMSKDESDMELLIYGAAGAAGTVALTVEAMNALMPSREDWIPPASDGASWVGAAGAASKTRARFGELLGRYSELVRRNIGLDELGRQNNNNNNGGTSHNGQGTSQPPPVISA